MADESKAAGAPEARKELREPKEETFGPVCVLYGAKNGSYPDGNTLLVEGERETVLIDPALGVLARRDAAGELPGALARVDRIVHSHCHEDHIAGSHLFPDLPWHFHELDAPGITHLDAMMAIYGWDADVEQVFRRHIVEQFHYTPRPDPTPYGGGDTFDLGGVRIEAIHTPGHTRGHCCLMVHWEEAGEPRRLLYLGDIDLSGFGPYYGDAWSDLADFERSLLTVRRLEADHYATFHHIGVLHSHAEYQERLAKFTARIAQREEALLEYLAEPHTLAEIVEHRFVYRPTADVFFADTVERRSMSQHIERLLEARRLKRVDGDRYVTP